jgi:hypothetical protein
MAQTAVPHVHGGFVNRWRGRSRDLDKSTRSRNRFRAVTSSPAAGSTPGRENGRFLATATPILGSLLSGRSTREAGYNTAWHD